MALSMMLVDADGEVVATVDADLSAPRGVELGNGLRLVVWESTEHQPSDYKEPPTLDV